MDPIDRTTPASAEARLYLDKGTTTFHNAMSLGNRTAISRAQVILADTDDKKPPKKDGFVDRMFNTYSSSKPYQDGASEIISQGAKTAATYAEVFLKSAMGLAEALDKIGETNIFLRPVTLVFKTAISMEMSRRENEQQIIQIRVCMKEMMSELLEIAHVQDDHIKHIEEKLTEEVKSIAESIEQVATACDGFKKSHLLVRVLKSDHWKEKLEEFTTRFNNHRLTLQSLLTVATYTHTVAMHREAKETNRMVYAMYNTFEEKDLAQKVGDYDSEDFLKDDALLITFVKNIEQKEIQRQPKDKRDAYVGRVVAQIKSDLSLNIQQILESHAHSFKFQFDLRLKQLDEQLKQLKELRYDGPYEEIQNQVIRELWKYMGWKGSTKARNFVLALRDFLSKEYIFNDDSHDHAKASSLKTATAPKSRRASISVIDVAKIQPSENVPEGKLGSAVATRRNSALGIYTLRTLSQEAAEDASWALPYLNVAHFRALMEAFDDDASGFVSVNEANALAQKLARPKGWSLLRWLAYWAVGFQQSLDLYSEQITSKLRDLHSFALAVLPPNRQTVQSYLASPELQVVDLLLASVKQACARVTHFDDVFMKHFLDHVQREEQRLRSNLVSVGFNIDSINALRVVTGPGRLEKYLFPLIYLLLERAVMIVRLAGEGRAVLNNDEFDVLVRSMEEVVNAAYERVSELNENFTYRNLPAEAELSKFAYGMYWLLSRADKDAIGGHRYYQNTGYLGPAVRLQWPIMMADNLSPSELDFAALRLGTKRSDIYQDQLQKRFWGESFKVAQVSLAEAPETLGRNSVEEAVDRKKSTASALCLQYVQLLAELDVLDAEGDKCAETRAKLQHLAEEIGEDSRDLYDAIKAFESWREDTKVFPSRYNCDLCSMSWGFKDTLTRCVTCSAACAPDSFDICQRCFKQTIQNPPEEAHTGYLYGQTHSSNHHVVFLRVQDVQRQRAGVSEQVIQAYRWAKYDFNPQSTPCFFCGTIITLPCLYCVECADKDSGTFVCLNCDKKRSHAEDRYTMVPHMDGSHIWMHPLIYLSQGSKNFVPPEPKPKPTAEALEAQREAHTARLEQRLEQMEGMLKIVVSQLGRFVGNSSDSQKAQDIQTPVDGIHINNVLRGETNSQGGNTGTSPDESLGETAAPDDESASDESEKE